MLSRILGLGASALLIASSALAADLPKRGAPPVVPVLAAGPSPLGIFSEVRLGAQAHDPWSPEKGSVDITGTILFVKPFKIDPRWDWIVPRPHIGGAVNTNSDTSHVNFGLTWNYDITSRLFLEASFGGAFHNGKTGNVVPADRSALGCSPLFRESAGIGFRIDQNWSIIASVEHLSNAGLCKQNRGLTNVGAQVGYRF